MNSFVRILVIVLLISCISISSIYSSTFQKEGEFWQTIHKRQIFWILIGLFLFILMSNFNYRRLWDFAFFLYIFALGLLLLVFILGTVRLGAQRWLTVGGFNFQPSELAKVITVIFLARYFSAKSEDNLSLVLKRKGVIHSFILPFIYTIILVALIIEQPDLGSGLIIVFVFMALTYIAGVRLRYIIMFLAFGVLSMPVLWRFLKDYQQERLLVFLNPNIDPLGAGYTVIQSKITVGSGGLFGKGWLGGTQGQLRFLPEAHTDFIFATFSEEWGFLGAGILLTMYYFLIKEGLMIADRTSDPFGKLLAYGLSLMLGIQIFINIAMTLGFMPVVGLPLPLMSYGGSSVVITFIALGILVNINKTRAVF